jgi:hypothetical protein
MCALTGTVAKTPEILFARISPSVLTRKFWRNPVAMSEWMGYSTDEICSELKITPSNAWVLLYRACDRLKSQVQDFLSAPATPVAVACHRLG